MPLSIELSLPSDLCRTAWRLLPGGTSAESSVVAERLVAGELVISGGRIVHAQDSEDWSAIAQLSRGDQRLAHMHGFIGDAVSAYERTGNKDMLRLALNLAIRWAEAHSYVQTRPSMAYHDETTARRVAYWVRLVLALRHAGMEDVAAPLRRRLSEEASILGQPDFHAGRNNHGMFQDFALLYYHVLIGEVQFDLSRSLERLVTYFEWSVSEDGVHKEHSPSYNFLIARNMVAHLPMIQQLDPVSGMRIAEVTKRMSRFAVHIVTPDGKYPPLGDTASVCIPPGYARTFALTNDVHPSLEQCAVFDKGGYAILRDDSARGMEQTYAVLSAAHHGNYHKHDDDLALIIFSEGAWILTEAGPYGYDYEHPLSKHAYSSAGHSTLEVCGSKPSRNPGLVQLTGWSHEDGGTSVVNGISRRHDGIVHRRRVAFDRRRRIITVEDLVDFDAGVVPPCRLLWQMPPGMEVQRDGCEFHLLTSEGKAAKISISGAVSAEDIHLAVGAEKGESAGYHFPDFGRVQDSPVIAVRRSDDNPTWAVTTTFVLPAISASGKVHPYDLHRGRWPIRYLVENEQACHLLVVVFPALAERFKYSINYRTALSSIRAHKLFLVDDFGPQGSYLICSNGEFSLAAEVQELIEMQRTKLAVPRENVVFLGSSKGGASALYHADKLGYGTSIVGAPQSRIGYFLCQQDRRNGPVIAEYMDSTPERETRLDQLLFERSPCQEIQRFIHVGRGDHHYRQHVLPYVEHMRKCNAHVEVDVGGYSSHAETGQHFPQYFLSKIAQLFGSDVVAQPDYFDVVARMKNGTEAAAGVLVAEALCDDPNVEIAFYLYRDGEVVEKRGYKMSRLVEFTPIMQGPNYWVRAFFRRDGTTFRRQNSNVIVSETN